MKIKTIVFVIALSLLFSIMLVAIGGEATYIEEVDESLESDPEIAQLADSPWPSFGRDQRNNRRSPYDTSHVDGTEKWSYETGDEVISSPAIGEDGTIYIGSRDYNLHAINPDGTEKWSFETNYQIGSSPVIGDDGTIYVGSYDSNLYAINPDGTEKWSFETGDMIYSSPTIDEDGNIYFGSFDNNLYAVSPDGTEEWSFETGDIIDSSPAIADDGSIYVGSNDNNLYAIYPNGTERWTFTTGDKLMSSPTIGLDGTIYIGSFDQNLYAVDPDGTEKWSFGIGWEPGTMSAIGEDGTIYVGGGDENLYAVNPDGSERWSFHTGGFVQSSPAIGDEGTIYIGSANNYLNAVNPDGTAKWSFPTDDEVRSSPAIGEDGTVYVGSFDNNLYAITGEHDLTINIEGEGSTDPQEGTHAYLHGDEVTVTATPEEDWYFEEWTGDYTGEDNPTTITMDSDKEITARFDTDQESYELEINIDGEGTVEVDGTEFDDGDTDIYLEGTDLTLEATPAQGWEFVEWTGTETGTDTTLEITMNEDKSITANFESEEDEVDGDYSHSITDDEDDVFYYYYSEDSWGWQENVERPDIDIIRASIEESGGVIFVELEVKGTIQEDAEIWYRITLEDEDGNSYEMGYAQGTGYLEHPTGAMVIEPSGFGTDTLEISFSLGDVGNPNSLEIVEVETHDWVDAEGEGEYYYDTAGPEADDPVNGDDTNGDYEFDEGIIDDLFARGMMCIAIAIIIPIIIIVIIIVVVIKLLSSEDEESDQPPQQGPLPEQQQPPQQQQPPSPPEDQSGSGETPPPPGNE